MIWCGDLNVAHNEIDIFGPKGKDRSAGFTKEERNSFGNFLNQGFIDTFRELHPRQTKYSYFNLRSGAREKGQGWRLDYFVVSRQLQKRVTESEINDEYYGSDHCPLSLTLRVGRDSSAEKNPEVVEMIIPKVIAESKLPPLVP